MLSWLVVGWCASMLSATTLALDISLVLNKPLQVVSEKFVSLTIDPHVLLNNQLLQGYSVAMARALSPAYLRLGGPSSNSIRFERNSPNTDNSTLSESDWMLLNKFSRDSGLGLIMCLNTMQRSNGEWDPRDALDLITFSNEKEFPLSWQLGYELQTISGTQLGHQLVRLKHILDAFPRYSHSPIFGPDILDFKTERDVVFLRDLLKEAGHVLDAVTWHPRFVRASNVCGVDASGEMVLDIDTLTSDKEELFRTFGKAISSKPLWIAESNSLSKPSQGWFLDALLWAQRLGTAARLGIQVVLRQPNIQGLKQPTPDYWVSVLHKALVGRAVLETRTPFHAEQNNSRTYVYAHCATNHHSALLPESIAHPKGAVTVFAVNLRQSKDQIQLRIPSWSGRKQEKKVYQYVITPAKSDNDLTSKDTLLNGKPLQLNPDGTLPIFRPKIYRISSRPTLSIPAGSVAFWVFPEARARACLIKLPKNTETAGNHILDFKTSINDENTNEDMNSFEVFKNKNKFKSHSFEIPLKKRLRIESDMKNEKLKIRRQNEDISMEKIDENLEMKERKKRFAPEPGPLFIHGYDSDPFRLLKKIRMMKKPEDMRRSLKTGGFKPIKVENHEDSFDENVNHFPLGPIYHKEQTLNDEDSINYDYIIDEQKKDQDIEDMNSQDIKLYHTDLYGNLGVTKYHPDPRLLTFSEIWEAENYQQPTSLEEESFINIFGQQQNDLIQKYLEGELLNNELLNSHNKRKILKEKSEKDIDKNDKIIATTTTTTAATITTTGSVIEDVNESDSVEFSESYEDSDETNGTTTIETSTATTSTTTTKKPKSKKSKHSKRTKRDVNLTEAPSDVNVDVTVDVTVDGPEKIVLDIQPEENKSNVDIAPTVTEEPAIASVNDSQQAVNEQAEDIHRDARDDSVHDHVLLTDGLISPKFSEKILPPSLEFRKKFVEGRLKTPGLTHGDGLFKPLIPPSLEIKKKTVEGRLKGSTKLIKSLPNPKKPVIVLNRVINLTQGDSLPEILKLPGITSSSAKVPQRFNFEYSKAQYEENRRALEERKELRKEKMLLLRERYELRKEELLKKSRELGIKNKREIEPSEAYLLFVDGGCLDNEEDIMQMHQQKKRDISTTEKLIDQLKCPRTQIFHLEPTIESPHHNLRHFNNRIPLSNYPRPSRQPPIIKRKIQILKPVDYEEIYVDDSEPDMMMLMPAYHRRKRDLAEDMEEIPIGRDRRIMITKGIRNEIDKLNDIMSPETESQQKSEEFVQLIKKFQTDINEKEIIDDNGLDGDDQNEAEEMEKIKEIGGEIQKLNPFIIPYKGFIKYMIGQINHLFRYFRDLTYVTN